MASRAEQREEDGFCRQRKATSVMGHRLRRKASIIDRWPRKLVKKDKHSMTNSYISLSQINDCDYPFHTVQACYGSDGDELTLSDCSLTEILIQTAHLDSSIVGLLVTPARHVNNQQDWCQSPSTQPRQPNTSNDYKSKHSSKPICKRMKSFRRNRTPNPRRTLAFLWTSLSNPVTQSVCLSSCLPVCLFACFCVCGFVLVNTCNKYYLWSLISRCWKALIINWNVHRHK